LALTSPTSGGRSVGIVRWQTKSPQFSFLSPFYTLVELGVSAGTQNSKSSENNLPAFWNSNQYKKLKETKYLTSYFLENMTHQIF
jgi:hypothetical protein